MAEVAYTPERGAPTASSSQAYPASVKAKPQSGVPGMGGVPTYQGQKQPHVRTRKDVEDFKLRQRQNAAVQSVLNDIARAPPSTWHAPKGYGTLQNGAQMEAARNKPREGMPGKSNHVDVPPWPPLPPDHAARHNSQNRERDIENVRIQKKLNEIYQKNNNKTSHVDPGRPILTHVDCTDRWTLRTRLYSPQKACPGGAPRPASNPRYQPTSKRPASACASSGGSASRPASRGASTGAVNRPSSAPRASVVTNIPKTLSMAKCSGCGAKSFRKADGVQLVPCKHCKKVYYCSETCASVDWKSHKQLCKYHTTGQWQSCGVRPADEYWVNNASMAKAREVLEKKADKGVKLTREEQLEEEAQIRKVLEATRAAELAAEKKQAAIERLATHGMDGPRPCLSRNGEPV